MEREHDSALRLAEHRDHQFGRVERVAEAERDDAPVGDGIPYPSPTKRLHLYRTRPLGIFAKDEFTFPVVAVDASRPPDDARISDEASRANDRSVERRIFDRSLTGMDCADLARAALAVDLCTRLRPLGVAPAPRASLGRHGRSVWGAAEERALGTREFRVCYAWGSKGAFHAPTMLEPGAESRVTCGYLELSRMSHDYPRLSAMICDYFQTV